MLRSWLILCMAMVALMVIVGGLTRLTESGLSMVHWKPTTILPPLHHTEWQAEFEAYKASPQYHQVNKGMSLSQFQGIFWLEYIHRLLGRLVGVIFLLPYLYFLARRELSGSMAWKLAGIFLLGGLQGVIGWYMVKSGLVDRPWVSPIRLAMHLGLAVIIFGLLWWQVMRLSPIPQSNLSSPSRLKNYPWHAALLLLYGQILLGALVAGLDAGLVYNSFPTMNGEWVPQGLWLLEPWYVNLAENATTVHFLHRLGALIVTLAIGFLAIKSRSWMLFGVLLLQGTLGALTVIYGVPIMLASVHQAVALWLFALVLRKIYI